MCGHVDVGVWVWVCGGCVVWVCSVGMCRMYVDACVYMQGL